MSTRFERMNDKAQNERHSKILQGLLQLPENRFCAECKRKDPRWASYSLGVFVCLRCSGIHRSLGTHISRMKSVDLDSWTPEQIQNMITWGNAKANWYWQARATFEPNDSNIELFIRCKYERRQFVHSPQLPDPSTIVIAEKPTSLSTPFPTSTPSSISSSSTEPWGFNASSSSSTPGIPFTAHFPPVTSTTPTTATTPTPSVSKSTVFADILSLYQSTTTTTTKPTTETGSATTSPPPPSSLLSVNEDDFSDFKAPLTTSFHPPKTSSTTTTTSSSSSSSPPSLPLSSTTTTMTSQNSHHHGMTSPVLPGSFSNHPFSSSSFSSSIPLSKKDPPPPSSSSVSPSVWSTIPLTTTSSPPPPLPLSSSSSSSSSVMSTSFPSFQPTPFSIPLSPTTPTFPPSTFTPVVLPLPSSSSSSSSSTSTPPFPTGFQESNPWASSTSPSFTSS